MTELSYQCGLLILQKSKPRLVVNVLFFGGNLENQYFPIKRNSQNREFCIKLALPCILTR